MENYKKICADCACLVEKKGEWCCDECFGQKCADLDECPEGVTLVEVTKAEDVKAPKLVARSDKKIERKPREKKVDNNKLWLIKTIRNCLNIYTCKGIENLKIVNDQREITFSYNDENYSLVLTKHRK